LKSFFWKKIMPYALLNQPTISFWEQRPDIIPLDFVAVSQLFRAKLAAKKKLPGTAAAASASLAVLDVQRATSVGVLMNKLHLPPARLSKAVFELDESFFVSRDEVDAILKCLPTADEIIKLMPYMSGKRPLADLAPVERFVLALHQIPQIELRLSTYAYKFSIPELISETDSVLTTRRAAMQQVCPPRHRSLALFDLFELVFSAASPGSCLAL
jgi:hypothetical protein